MFDCQCSCRILILIFCSSIMSDGKEAGSGGQELLEDDEFEEFNDNSMRAVCARGDMALN